MYRVCDLLSSYNIYTFLIERKKKIVNVEKQIKSGLNVKLQLIQTIVLLFILCVRRKNKIKMFIRQAHNKKE